MRRGKQEEETGPRSRGKKVRVGAERSLVGERGRLGLEEGDPRGSLRLCSSRQGSHCRLWEQLSQSIHFEWKP